jgi:hypothetical protein
MAGRHQLAASALGRLRNRAPPPAMIAADEWVPCWAPSAAPAPPGGSWQVALAARPYRGVPPTAARLAARRDTWPDGREAGGRTR